MKTDRKRFQKSIVIIVMLSVFGLLALGLVVYKTPKIKYALRNVLRQTGLKQMALPVLRRVGWAGPAWSERFVSTPNPPASRVSARGLVVNDLYRALADGDAALAARFNSILAQEAFLRAYRTMKAWETMRDPETKLLPKSFHPGMAYWDPEDVAADLFPFLLLAGLQLDSESRRLWLETLRREREICGAMPCSVRLSSGQRIEESLSRILFSASEYAKDGLLAVSEWSGPGPWLDRLEEVMHSLVDSAYIQTEAGPLCDSGTEVNGEMLQVLSRLYWRTGNKTWLEMAERIAETYLFVVLPRNNYLPARRWDLRTNKPESRDFRLRDHGSELLSGLAELYLLEKLHGRPQAPRFREPLKRFLDTVLTLPRTDDGLWYDAVDATTRIVVDEHVVDTWGYLLLGYQAFDLAEGSDLYGAEIERVMRAAAARRSFPWEGDLMDGYADAIESMLYLLPRHDIPECRRWVDDEIEVMLSRQSSDGFVEKWYLDGNYIRTALLYAGYKTQGTGLQPWRQDTRLGAARDANGGGLYLYLAADTEWRGRLCFDPPRHQTIWNLPFEYPRLNGRPEWFVAQPDTMYVVRDLDSEVQSVCSGRQLTDGLDTRLCKENGYTLRLRVWPEQFPAKAMD